MYCFVCRDLKMENIMLDESLRNIKLIGERFASIFTVRHVMQRTVLLSQFCPSGRLSVCLMVYCDKTK